MEYLTINSNMHRSPVGGQRVVKVERENGKASRCGAMSKNANSKGTDSPAYHSKVMNDKEKGISVPEPKSKDEEKVLEKTVTTCGMTRNVPNYFRVSRPMTRGYAVREDGSFEVTDLPHLMKVLDACGEYVPGEVAAKLRYEVGNLGKMLQGNKKKEAFLPMLWGTFLAIPLVWIDVRMMEETRRVKLRDGDAGVLDLALSKIFTRCDSAGFNREFFKEFTSCVGWQNPTKESEAFVMLLLFCAMARAILTSKAAEELQKGGTRSKEERMEAYEELTKILWLPTVEPEWLDENFPSFLAELHSTAAWAMTVHLIGQLEAVAILDPRDQIMAIAKAFQLQILANEVVASPTPAFMAAKFNGISKRVGGPGLNALCVDGEGAARAGGFLSPCSSPDTFESRASSPASFGSFEEGEVETLLNARRGDQIDVAEKSQMAPIILTMSSQGGEERDEAVENLQGPTSTAIMAETVAEAKLTVEHPTDPAVYLATKTVPTDLTGEYLSDTAAFFATKTVPVIAEPGEETAVENLPDYVALTEAALLELEIVTQGYVEIRATPGAEDHIQKRAMEVGPREVLERLLRAVLGTEEDEEVSKARAAAHTFILERWDKAERSWRDNAAILVRSPDRRYNVLTLLLEIQTTWPYTGSQEWREEGEAQLLEIGELRHRRRQWLGLMINSGALKEGADVDFARMVWNRCRPIENAVAHGKKKLLPLLKATLSASKICIISDLIPAFEKDIIARKARLSDVLVFAASIMVGPEAPIESPAAQKALFLRKEGGTLTHLVGSAEEGAPRAKLVVKFTPAIKISQGQRKRLRYQAANQRRAAAKLSPSAQAKKADLMFLEVEARKAGWRSKKEKRKEGGTEAASPAAPPAVPGAAYDTAIKAPRGFSIILSP